MTELVLCPKWQPINTCPNEIEVDLLLEKETGVFTTVVALHVNGKFFVFIPRIDGVTTQSEYHEISFEHSIAKPTHWQPRPNILAPNVVQTDKVANAIRNLMKDVEEAFAASITRNEKSCTCHACTNGVDANGRVYFVVCSICGNKRCPKADDHRYVCTGSNDVGQVGKLS